MEPCVELRLDTDGLNVQIEWRMDAGQVNWKPEELSTWIAEIAVDADAILLQRAVSGDTVPRRLVKSGYRNWQNGSLLTGRELAAMEHPVPTVTERVPEALPPSQSRLNLNVEAPEPPVQAPDVDDPELTPEAISQALQAPPPPASTGPRRPEKDVAKSKQGKAILQVLRKSKEPLDITAVRDQSKLSDYMTRKTLQELRDGGHIVEGAEEVGGRWGQKAIYSSK
jgi:hypothetical protein